MYLNKIRVSLEEQAEQEYANAKAERNKANIDYVAMMADIDIPAEETNDVRED